MPRALGSWHDMSGMEAGPLIHYRLSGRPVCFNTLCRHSSRTLRKGREVPRTRHSDQHNGGGAAKVFAPLPVDGLARKGQRYCDRVVEIQAAIISIHSWICSPLADALNFVSLPTGGELDAVSAFSPCIFIYCENL